MSYSMQTLHKRMSYQSRVILLIHLHISNFLLFNQKNVTYVLLSHPKVQQFELAIAWVLSSAMSWERPDIVKVPISQILQLSLVNGLFVNGNVHG